MHGSGVGLIGSGMLDEEIEISGEMEQWIAQARHAALGESLAVHPEGRYAETCEPGYSAGSLVANMVGEFLAALQELLDRVVF
jgi:hypothetical protein